MSRLPFRSLLAEPVRNGIYKPRQFHGSGVKIVNMRELFAHDLISSEPESRVRLSEAEIAKSHLRDGDLLFARRSFVLEGAGKCSLVVEPPETLTFESSMIRARPDKTKAVPRYLLYYFQSPAGKANMASIASRTAVSGITGSNLSALLIEIPSLQTQQQISDLLKQFDDLIENNRRRVEILEEMARRIYREWFVKFRYPGHESVPLVDSELGPIPDGWEIRKLGDVLDLAYGKSLRAADRSGGHAAVVGSSGIVGWHDKALIPAPAIVVGRKGNVGSITWLDVPSWPIDTTYYVVTDLPKRFVAEQLRHTEFINSHAAVPGLNRDQAYSKPFLLPSHELIDRYQAIAEALGQAASSLEKQSTLLEKQRDLLLPKLVTGRIDVSSLNLDELLEEVAV